MRVKLLSLLFILAVGFLWTASPAGAVDDYWYDDCQVNPEAEENVIVNEFGERIYHNVDQKVYWDLARDFCVSFELMVAYNFALFPRKPEQYTYIKIPPGRDEASWIPGQSLDRPDDVPDHIAAEFYFDETPTDQFAWPVKQEVGVVSQLYHDIHRGVDIDVNSGSDVLAIGNGRVIRTDENHRIYGTVVMIDHGNDIMAIYAHLSEITVSVNQFVSKEEIIGLSGNTGMSSAPHLHFELRDSFEVTDPCNYYENCPDEAFHGPPRPHYMHEVIEDHKND